MYLENFGTTWNVAPAFWATQHSMYRNCSSQYGNSRAAWHDKQVIRFNQVWKLLNIQRHSLQEGHVTHALLSHACVWKHSTWTPMSCA